MSFEARMQPSVQLQAEEIALGKGAEGVKAANENLLSVEVCLFWLVSTLLRVAVSGVGKVVLGYSFRNSEYQILVVNSGRTAWAEWRQRDIQRSLHRLIVTCSSLVSTVELEGVRSSSVIEETRILCYPCVFCRVFSFLNSGVRHSLKASRGCA